MLHTSQGDLRLKWDDLHLKGNSQWFIKITVSELLLPPQQIFISNSEEHWKNQHIKYINK